MFADGESPRTLACMHMNEKPVVEVQSAYIHCADTQCTKMSVSLPHWVSASTTPTTTTTTTHTSSNVSVRISARPVWFSARYLTLFVHTFVPFPGALQHKLAGAHPHTQMPVNRFAQSERDRENHQQHTQQPTRRWPWQSIAMAAATAAAASHSGSTHT